MNDTLSDDMILPACQDCNYNRNGLFTAYSRGDIPETYRCERCGSLFDTEPRHPNFDSGPSQEDDQ